MGVSCPASAAAVDASHPSSSGASPRSSCGSRGSLDGLDRNTSPSLPDRRRGPAATAGGTGARNRCTRPARGRSFLAHYATRVATTPEDPPAAAATYRQSGFPAIPGAADILLIRHGESQAYTPGIPFPMADGHGDPPLAPNGHEQAKLLADRLASAAIDAIYVTTLRRTAAVEPDLREVHLGEWEGGEYRQRVAEHDPLVMEAFSQERWDVIPGAESPVALSARVREAIERIALARRGQRVAVFAHGGVIGEVLAQASGSRPFAFITSDNASISRLIVTDERWFVRAFNDTAHLECSA